MLAKSQSSAYAEYEDLVFKHKPTREPGQDIRTLPTYTIPEAASYLAIDAWTLLNWYSKRDPILTPSGWYGDTESFALLSFRDLEEAYKLHLLRTKFGYSMQYLCRALADARQLSKSDHPLIDSRIIVFDRLALQLPGRGKRSARTVALGSTHKPLYIREVVETWGKRIIPDKKGQSKQIFPWRFARQDDVSRPVSLEPDVMSGRLVVTGTRIPVTVLSYRNAAGETPEELAHDYGINADIVRKAIAHFDQENKRPMRSVS
jgi:uncharacterized protein (DUF433 family)